MKNIVITALVVSQLFTAALLYAFTSGEIERVKTNYIDAMQVARSK